MADTQAKFDVAVIGGGIGGLTAAATLARQGRSVVVLEKAPRLGGRGMTQTDHGFSFNLGPHALYRGGHAMRVLKSLGIEPKGGVPSQVGGFAIHGGTKHTLPGGLVSLLTTDLLGVAGKIDVARALAGLPRLDPSTFDDVSWSTWSDSYVRDAVARQLLTAISRLATYANAPELLSAGAAIRQLQLALGKNVLYLDGGWQTLVDQLSELARQGGTQIRQASAVRKVTVDDGGAVIELDGENVTARAAVLAVPPKAAAGLVEGEASAALGEWAEQLRPVRAACLDLGLSTLAKSRNLFALGVDQPIYLSVHTAVARLAESGKATVQLAKYLPAEEAGDSAAVEAELEVLADLVQPGWRDLLEERRFLPDMVVTYALPEAKRGGTAGRPGPAVPGTRNLFVVGDWVGSVGMLVDASFASADRAATQLHELLGADRAAA